MTKLVFNKSEINPSGQSFSSLLVLLGIRSAALSKLPIWVKGWLSQVANRKKVRALDCFVVYCFQGYRNFQALCLIYKREHLKSWVCYKSYFIKPQGGTPYIGCKNGYQVAQHMSVWLGLVAFCRIFSSSFFVFFAPRIMWNRLWSCLMPGTGNDCW